MTKVCRRPYSELSKLVNVEEQSAMAAIVSTQRSFLTVEEDPLATSSSLWSVAHLISMAKRARKSARVIFPSPLISAVFKRMSNSLWLISPKP